MLHHRSTLLNTSIARVVPKDWAIPEKESE